MQTVNKKDFLMENIGKQKELPLSLYLFLMIFPLCAVFWADLLFVDTLIKQHGYFIVALTSLVGTGAVILFSLWFCFSRKIRLLNNQKHWKFVQILSVLNLCCFSHLLSFSMPVFLRWYPPMCEDGNLEYLWEGTLSHPSLAKVCIFSTVLTIFACAALFFSGSMKQE